MTHERDPTAQRQDYRYFPKNTYWLLIEDIDGTHAPIAVKDYGWWKPRAAGVGASSSAAAAKGKKPVVKKGRHDALFYDHDGGEEEEEKKDLPPWPPLRDAPGKAKPDWAYGKVSDSRDRNELEDDVGPSGQSDGVEIQLMSDGEGDNEDAEGEPDPDAEGDGDGSVTDTEEENTTAPAAGHELRRAASMHDLGRSLAHPHPHHHPAQKHPARQRAPHPQQTYRARDREYIAASGNSVTITSHVNSTTSYAQGPGGGELSLGPGGRALEKRLHHQVLTRAAATTASGAVGSVAGWGDVAAGAASGKSSTSVMMSTHRAQRVLRKAKSTNTLRNRGLADGGGSHATGKTRLPTREEQKKPGYCENCRQRFDDFTAVCFLCSLGPGSPYIDLCSSRCVAHQR